MDDNIPQHPPTYGASAFNCPRCRAFVKQEHGLAARTDDAAMPNNLKIDCVEQSLPIVLMLIL